jgi:phage/plasmid-like protein (TIGR03299 family)
MSDEVFGERFFGALRPAWHRKGVVLAEPTSATDAYSLLGPYTVALDPLVTQYGMPVSAKAIVRAPTHDEPIRRVFGVVSDRYKLITPEDIVEAYDRYVNKPVETMAALKHGAVFLLSTKLPDYDVNGDEIENYMLVDNWMTGTGACHVRVTPIRVVCQNTLSMAIGQAGETHRIIHTGSPLQELEDWLVDVYSRAVHTSSVVKEAFEILAKAQFKQDKAIRVILKEVYPYPAGKTLETQMEAVDTTRNSVLHLFNGMAAGADTKAFKGTAWGLYNSVVEFEDRYHRAGSNFAESILFGSRARVKERAFEKTLNYATTV